MIITKLHFQGFNVQGHNGLSATAELLVSYRDYRILANRIRVSNTSLVANISQVNYLRSRYHVQCARLDVYATNSPTRSLPLF